MDQDQKQDPYLQALAEVRKSDPYLSSLDQVREPAQDPLAGMGPLDRIRWAIFASPEQKQAGQDYVIDRAKAGTLEPLGPPDEPGGQSFLPILGALLASRVPGGGILMKMLQAAGGGAAGQGVNDTINAIGGAPAPTTVADELKSMGGTGVMTGLAEGAGQVISRIPPALQTFAREMKQRLIKPSLPALEQAHPSWGKTDVEREQNIAKELLEKRIRLNLGGRQKLEDERIAINNEITQAIKGSTATVPTAPVETNLLKLQDRYGRQSFPESSQATVQAKLDELLRNPLVSHPMTAMGPGGGTVRVLQPQVPVHLAQELKQGDYRTLGNAAFGELKGPETEAIKTAARGWKTGIETAVPGIQDLNTAESRIIDMRDILDPTLVNVGKRNMLDLTTAMAARSASAATPGGSAYTIAALANRPGLGDPVAHGAYRLGKAIPTGTGPGPSYGDLLRLAWTILNRTPDQE